jgi:hypothetical protein
MSRAVAMTSSSILGLANEASTAGFLSCLRLVGIVNPLFGADYHQMICFDPIVGLAAGRVPAIKGGQNYDPNPCELCTYHLLNFFCRCNECHVLLNCCLRVPRTFSGSIQCVIFSCLRSYISNPWFIYFLLKPHGKLLLIANNCF